MKERPGKVLGVLGGMGPAASAEFMRLLSLYAPARLDQDHPRVVLLSDPWIPDRSQAILDKGKDPGPAIRSGLETLLKWGADILAVPCNTAHYFIENFDRERSLPLVHIVEATMDEVRRSSPGGAWLLATRGTLKCGIYQHYAETIGYSLSIPHEQMLLKVQDVIHLVKANQLERSGRLLEEVIRYLWKVSEIPVIAACTEIPLAYSNSGLPAERMISSLEALARACISRLYE